MKHKKRFFSNVPIQLKIIGLVIALMLLIIGSITSLFIVIEYQEDIEKAEDIAFQTAETLSYMPILQEALIERSNLMEVRSILENVRQDVHASAIIISDRKGIFLMDRTNQQLLNYWGEDGVQNLALLYGNSYVKTVGERTEGVLIGVSAINIDYGGYKKVEGTVSVVYDMNSILAGIIEGAQKILLISLIALVCGIFGSWILARDIRRDMLGLEPKEIAALYQERIAVFQSIRDGLIVVGSNEEITMMNQTAKKILHLEKDVKGKTLDDVLESADFPKLLRSLKGSANAKIEYGGKMYITNSYPVYQEESRIGTIYSLRDKTDVRKMAATLTEVQQYSEDMRAQTHEFKNKLHVLLGLLQLGRSEDAIDFINEENDSQQMNVNVLENGILDDKVQAILLGKIAKASEMKERFSISPESSINALPEHIELLPLLTIIGNLIDNAFDAVKQVEGGNVSFFATDFGKDIIFEVTNNGPAIPEEIVPFFFNKGYSAKGKNRGYGLYNVIQELTHLGGGIEVDSDSQTGTTFTVILPKEYIQDEAKEGIQK